MNSDALANSLSNSHQRATLAPKFSGSRVSSFSALSGLLGIEEAKLHELIEAPEQYYRLKERKKKPDGSVRDIYKVKEPLKHILKKVNRVFFHRCQFAKYLTGSLPGWSYEENAAIHIAQGTVITIDATNFFPSISQEQVKEIWLNFFKFAEPVAEALSKLCCYKGFLAQGSPPSSYLANLLFFDIEPLIVKELTSRG